MEASEIFESDEQIAEKYDENFSGYSSLGEELAVEIMRDTERLTD